MSDEDRVFTAFELRQSPPGHYLKLLYDEKTDKYYTPILRPDQREEIKRYRSMGLTGRGVKVAVLDTGFMSSHPVIKRALKGSVNFTEEETAEDMDGHGTMVTLLLMLYSPEADVYNVKVLNSKRSGHLKNVVKGVEWCIENEMKIINMSLGSYSEECKGDCGVCTACKKALESDIVVCAAAGNIPGKTACPAKLVLFGHPILAVGAVDPDTFKRTDYSGVGELYAPEPVVSLVPVKPQDK